MISDKQTIIAYLGQAALLLRRRALKEKSDIEAERIATFAADIQRFIEAIEHRI